MFLCPTKYLVYLCTQIPIHAIMNEKKKGTRQLTKAETLVMNVLWGLPSQQGFIQDIIDQYPEPKPAYTTILTFMKILTDKGFVKPEKIGKANRFTPLVSKDDYTYSYIADVKDIFFEGSFTNLVSFFVQKEHYSEEEMSELKQLMKTIEEKNK